MISHYSSLEEFIEKFFLILQVLWSERDQKAALTVQKVPVVFHDTTDDTFLRYMKYLTHYAYQFVAKQLSLKGKVILLEQTEEETFKILSSEGK